MLQKQTIKSYKNACTNWQTAIKVKNNCITFKKNEPAFFNPTFRELRKKRILDSNCNKGTTFFSPATFRLFFQVKFANEVEGGRLLRFIVMP